MTLPKISIALCTYNGEAYLADQLQSFAAQTWLPDELVVCDDRSSDDTIRIVNEFSENANFSVRLVVNDTNLRSTKNFERAIGLCSGDVIFLSDQDDVWRSDKIERMATVFIERPEVGAVFSDATVVDAKLASLGYRMWDVSGFGAQFQDMFRRNPLEVLLRRNVVTGATLAFRSSLRPLIVPIPPCWVHDGWVAMVVSAVAKIEFIAEPLIEYRQHSSNQIGGMKKGVFDRLRLAKATRLAVYESLAEQADSAEKRLGEHKNALLDTCILAQLKQKAEHHLRRGSFPTQHFLRLPMLIREVLAGHYHRYSNGWVSIGKDLFL